MESMRLFWITVAATVAAAFLIWAIGSAGDFLLSGSLWPAVSSAARFYFQNLAAFGLGGFAITVLVCIYLATDWHFRFSELLGVVTLYVVISGIVNNVVFRTMRAFSLVEEGDVPGAFLDDWYIVAPCMVLAGVWYASGTLRILRRKMDLVRQARAELNAERLTKPEAHSTSPPDNG